MLILIPTLYFWTKFLYNHFFKRKKHVSLIMNCNFGNEKIIDLEYDLKFDPPVYKLRYAIVQDILLEEINRNNLKKVVEFGCAEMKLIDYIKNLFYLEKILLVDIDEDLLKENIFRIRPRTIDYINKRREPLEVSVFAGSISDPDCNLVDTDAVIGIEIIEHLYPDVLEALPHNIFGYMQPNVIILTTPNADFNVLFAKFKGMRHPDHKFEWTRQQFMDWALNITERYPQYNVTFTGVGEPPPEHKQFGFCSQIAIFRKTAATIIREVPCNYGNEQHRETGYNVYNNSFGICTYYSYRKQIDLYESNILNEERSTNDHGEASNLYYHLIEREEYPFDDDMRTIEEKILDELKYNIYRFGSIKGSFFNENTDRSEIPLYVIVKNVKGNFVSESKAREVLETNGFKVEDCLVNGFQDICVLYEPIMDDNSSPPLSDSNDDEQDNYKHDDENWDLTYNNPINTTDKMVNAETNTINNNNNNNNNNNANSSNAREDTQRKSTLKGNSQQKILKIVAIDDCINNRKVKNEESSNTYDKLNRMYPGPSTSTSAPYNTQTDSTGSSSHQVRRKRKRKYDCEDETIRDEMQNIAKNLVYNTLNTVDRSDSSCDTKSIPITNLNSISNISVANMRIIDSMDDTPRTFLSDHRQLDDDGIPERELAHASREVLFDPRSEVSMLEDFNNSETTENWDEGTSNQNVAQPQVVLLGINVNNDEDDVLRLPPNANPFPNWLLQLLSANAVETGTESHDEPHFYCQGDGIGVHPSIVEVDLEEDISSSDSSNNDDDAEANVSETDVSQIPEDLEDVVPTNSLGVVGIGLGHHNVSESSIPETSSNHDSADEYYDTIEEHENTNNTTFNEEKK